MTPARFVFTGLVFTGEGGRALDAELARLGLLEPTLELVGTLVARRLSERFPGARVLVLAGGGANGGDALVAARHLLALGHAVRVLAAEARGDLVKTVRARLEALAPVGPLEEGAVRDALPNADVVLDGLLGTGYAPPLRPDLAAVVRAVNASGRAVVAVDVPSGVLADAAEAPGEGDLELRADVTLTPVGLKPALLWRDLGETEVLDVGLPPDLLARFAGARVVGDEEVRARLPVRGRGAHKGTAGRVWILGGAPGYTGAPALSALGALRAGAGLVSLYSRADVTRHPLEAMAHRLDAWDDLPDDAPNAVAVGMGLRAEAPDVARRVLARRLPAVLDADALVADLRGAGHDDVVWTPHPGEAARMLGVRTPDVTRDPLAAAGELRAAFGGAVVLKGGPSVVATADGAWVCPHGNPGMATGGMGDVLSGVIAALLGQGLSAADAAVAGVDLHARAGDRAERRHGYGLIASDVADELGAAWRAVAGRRGAANG